MTVKNKKQKTVFREFLWDSSIQPFGFRCGLLAFFKNIFRRFMCICCL